MRARPVLADLATTARTDVRLGALNGHDIVYLGQFGRFDESTRNAVGADNGGTGDLAPALPAYATAIGKALLAFSPADRRRQESLPRVCRGRTRRRSPDNLRQALSVIRLTQIATARDEHHADRSTIAVPVFSGGGRVAAAVELTVHEPGTDVQAVTGALTVACRSLSRQLATEFRDRRTVGHNGKGPTSSA